MGLETAAVIGLASLAVGAASTGASVYASNKQTKVAKNAAEDQAAEQARMRSELVEKQKQEEASTAAQDARSRQRGIGSKLGRSGTVLTSPIGMPGPGYSLGGTRAA